VVKLAQQKIILTNIEPDINATADELANVVIWRLGLMPRKKGSTEKMNKVLIELYERAKQASKQKQQTKAIMTVEDMAMFAGITRQTMYDYIKRWLDLDLIIKTSYIGLDNKVVVGYKLNGNTLETTFDKAKVRIINHLDLTKKYILELQKQLKNEKISQKFSEKRDQ
jgi:hypothetical protein